MLDVTEVLGDLLSYQLPIKLGEAAPPLLVTTKTTKCGLVPNKLLFDFFFK